MAKPIPTEIPDDVKARFWRYVSPEPNNGCWLWTGGLSEGYGRFALKKGDSFFAHRLAYSWSKGPIPEVMQLDHLCRVRCCVNPDHLEPVTNQENARRGLTGAHVTARNAKITHCPQGHAYDDKNTNWKITKGGYPNRQCRACARDYAARKRASRTHRAARPAMM